MRNSSAIKIIGLGLAIYVGLVFTVVSFIPDKPENMDWSDRQSYNKVQVGKLKLGATRDEVLARMGSPDITEAKEQDSDVFQIMFFRTQHIKADGITTKDECTPLLFKNDKLVALGESAFSEYEHT